MVIGMASEKFVEGGGAQCLSCEDVYGATQALVHLLREKAGRANDQIIIDPGLAPVGADTYGLVNMGLDAMRLIRANAELAGVAQRTTQLAGDAFEVDLGGPHDLALVVNFVHHFDLATCVRFLAKLRRSLAPGGQVCIVEFLIDESRVKPVPPATFSLVMLATTRGGDSFTEAEMRTMLEGAGFRGFAREELEGFNASAVFATA